MKRKRFSVDQIVAVLMAGPTLTYRVDPFKGARSGCAFSHQVV